MVDENIVSVEFVAEIASCFPPLVKMCIARNDYSRIEQVIRKGAIDFSGLGSQGWSLFALNPPRIVNTAKQPKDDAGHILKYVKAHFEFKQF